jgi:hypothetical protein
MKLKIDPHRWRVYLDGRNDEIALNEYYGLDGEYQFIVQKFGHTGYLIQIKKGLDPIQQGFVHFANPTAGRARGGQPYPNVYEANLDPDQPIYPLGEVIEALIKMGVKAWQISPMFSDPLHHSAAWHVSPMLESDGEIAYVDLPEDDIYLGSRDFTVTNATWAVVSVEEGQLAQVYLWRGVEDPVNMAALIETIRGLELFES